MGDCWWITFRFSTLFPGRKVCSRYESRYFPAAKSKVPSPCVVVRWRDFRAAKVAMRSAPRSNEVSAKLSYSRDFCQTLPVSRTLQISFGHFSGKFYFQKVRKEKKSQKVTKVQKHGKINSFIGLFTVWYKPKLLVGNQLRFSLCRRNVKRLKCPRQIDLCSVSILNVLPKLFESNQRT